MLYDDKAPEILKQYNVRAFPTFVVTDAEGTEMLRSIGAPFRDVQEAAKWFPTVKDKIKNASESEASFKAEPTNRQLADEAFENLKNNGQMAAAASVYKTLLDKLPEDDASRVDLWLEVATAYKDGYMSDKALEVFEKLNELVTAEHEKYVDVQLAYADALRGSMNRENQAEVGKQISAIYDKVLPDIIKKGEDRAIAPAVLNARIKSIVDKDNEAARKQMTDMLEPYAEHERILEIKYWAAYFAEQNGDKDTAKIEYAAIIEEGGAEDQYAKAAQQRLDGLNGVEAKPKEGK